MKPVVPYQFDPPANDWEQSHLVWEDVKGGRCASWPIVGERILRPDNISSLEDYVSPNNGAFRPHGNFGFTIGRYSEFLLNAPDFAYCAFDMAGIEASFGEATPLAAMVFWPIHFERIHGLWDEFTSLRIYGIAENSVELAFLNAMTAYQEKFTYLPEIFHLWPDDNREPSDRTAQVYPSPPMFRDIDPLRFYYNGLAQSDDVAACIYFYRTLEYFSFFTNATEMSRLRHDSMTSDAEFSRKILELISRDEKGPIFKLITSIVDGHLLEFAASKGLMKGPAANTLCEAVYAFRNSIVHGKFSYGYSLLSGSVLEREPNILHWRTMLRGLARLSLEKHGARGR